MVRRKTSEGFARVMSKVLKYLVMFVVIYYFAAAAFVFGRQLFTDKGAAPAPGMDMTIEVTKNTSIKDFAKKLVYFNTTSTSRLSTMPNANTFLLAFVTAFCPSLFFSPIFSIHLAKKYATNIAAIRYIISPLLNEQKKIQFAHNNTMYLNFWGTS